MIQVDHIQKVFPGDVQAVRDVSFRVAKGETLVLVGLSGCGKTTTLKMINRLVEPDSGDIVIDDIDVKEWDPIALRRSIGYVIQEIGLLPHITVGENVGMVLKLKGWEKKKADKRIQEMLCMVGLAPAEFENRYPHELSGGQKQRIGVARALAADPDILLMDEPFGALDPITREDLQDEFIKLEKSIKKTVVLVTHDIFEAVKMGDRIAIMKNGEIEQVGYPESIMDRPASKFVKRLMGKHREALRIYLKNRSVS